MGGKFASLPTAPSIPAILIKLWAAQRTVIDLGAVEQVSVLRIDWANPYAGKYEVQYWVSFRNENGSVERFTGPVKKATFVSQQYMRHWEAEIAIRILTARP